MRYIFIAFDIEVNHELLKKSFMLNGIQNWIIPNVSTPENEKIHNPGGFLPFDEEDKENRYALLKYSDKRLHYISARSQLYATFKYIQRLKADNEVVLSEMRYVSVKPGSTKLHFLIESIRRNFECGIWLRWKNLEDNYFRFIAPIVVTKYYGAIQESLLRSINLNDMMTTLSILGLGLLVSCLVYYLENLISKLLIKCHSR